MTIINNQFLPDAEWVGRFVKNAFGVDESISLPITHWKHFDWLAEIGTDMDQFTMDCDVNRHINQPYRISFSGYVCKKLVRDEARRHRAGEDVPLFINPDRPLEIEETPFHKEVIVREVVVSTGETVPVPMERGCWKYLDWLGRHGIDTTQFIIDADVTRQEPKWKYYTLKGFLERLLREDEKKRYFSDEPSPLFINPDGYDE